MKKGYYIGLDIASEVTVAYVVDQEGKVVSDSRFITEEQSIRCFFRSVPRPRYSVLEEGTQADWILRIAREECDRASACKLFGKGQLSGEYKGDDPDAYNLALKLMKGDIVEVWHDSQLRRKDVMQYALTYITVVKECTRNKNRIKAVFRSEGIKVGTRAYDKSTRGVEIAKLPVEGEKHRVKALGELLDNLTKLRKEAWSAFYKEIKKYDLFKRLLRVPAFGKVSAALVTAIMWDPIRFANKRRFWAYVGFSIRTEDSGQYEVDKKTKKIRRKKRTFTLGLTREHNRVLKSIFKRAALALRRRQWSAESQRLKSAGMSEENILVHLVPIRKTSATVRRKFGHLWISAERNDLYPK